jgi:hypothetical protein
MDKEEINSLRAIMTRLMIKVAIGDESEMEEIYMMFSEQFKDK